MLTKRTGIAALLLILLCGCTSAYALGTSEAYYLSFDEFVMNNSASSGVTKSSPYDVSDNGGSVSLGYVTDLSEYDSVEEKRNFNRAEGKIVWELCVDTSNAPNNGTISLRCGETDAIRLVYRKGTLRIATPQGETLLTGDNGFYGIKAQIDIDSKTYDMQVNGSTVGRNIGFLNSAAYLDNFYVFSPDESTGVFLFSAMRIHKNYVLNEWFMTSRSLLPDDWSTIGNGVKTAKLDSSIQNDSYSLELSDNDFTRETGVSHSIEYESDGLQLEFQFLAPKKIKEFAASLIAENQTVIRFGCKGLEFGYWNGGEFVPLYTMRENLWYHAMIKLKQDGAQIFINHKLVGDKIDCKKVKIDTVAFATGKAATGSVYIDDIMAKPIYPLPDDYVPAPQKPEKKNDTIVSIQSCNIWREGTHFGWDSLAPYSERKPYLGFYDEGSSEARDWETKWMVEHGIDAEIYCWYRQPSSTSAQIKRPRNSYGLHDGFFNSEYSHMMKFAISWENGVAQTTGFDDFAQNIVPYWIEQYFKDDRYLVIDNRPVIGIYVYSNLIRDFGSEQGAKAALEYLEGECRKIGFDGAYFIATTSTSSNDTLKKISDMGFDGVYCYSWDVGCYDIDVQKRGMQNQLDTGAIDVVPTIGMGRDDTPWERSPGGFVPLDDYSELLEWVRDEFVPSMRSGSLGRKLITLDNWNEYCEGHFLMPSPLAGFGYLDAVRSAYTNGSEHSDSVPESSAKERFNRLYIQDRHVEKSFRAKQLEQSKADEGSLSNYDTVRGWYFDGAEDVSDFTIAKQIENFKIENGVLSGDATDSDPGFYIKDINYPTSAIKGIRVRFRTDTAQPKMQFYFVTDQVSNYSEGKSMFKTAVTDGGFAEVVLDPAEASNWSGTLTEFRVDPMATTGHFEIDSIEIIGTDISKPQPFNINSQPQYSQRGVIIENGKMFVPAEEYAQTFGFKWCDSIDGKYLKLLNSDTGQKIELEYGKDAVMHNGESLFALRTVAEEAGCTVAWDNETQSANVIKPNSGIVNKETDPEGEINFNYDGKLNGIASYGNMSGIRVENGSMSATATTADPNMRLSFSLDAEKNPYCHIRIKNKSFGTVFKIYFTTETEKNFNETRACEVKLSSGDKAFKNYTVKMADNSLWRGKIVDIRIDPTDGMGDFSIDYIRFSDSAETGDDSSETESNIIAGGIMETEELDFKECAATAAYTEENAYIGRKSLKITAQNGGYISVTAKINAGDKYTLSFAAESAGARELRIGLCFADGTVSELKTVKLPTSGWTKLSHSFVPEISATGIYIMPISGTVLADNLRLAEKKAAAASTVEKPRYTERSNPKTGPLKILIIGNSITHHDKSEAIGWLGDWGMAATSADKDYVHILKTFAEKKDSNVQVKWANVSEFERCFYDFSLFNKSKYEYLRDFDADIIICAFGANIKNPENENDPTFAAENQFKPQHYAAIADYFNQYGDAEVISAVTPLTSYEVRAVIEESAKENEWRYIDMSDLGAEEYTAKGSASSDVFGSEVTAGVLSHPGDLGMQKIAERIEPVLAQAMDNKKR